MKFPLSATTDSRAIDRHSTHAKSSTATPSIKPIFKRDGMNQAQPERVPGGLMGGVMGNIEFAARGVGERSQIPRMFLWTPSAGGEQQHGLLSHNNGNTMISGLEGDGPFALFRNGQLLSHDVTNTQELADVLRGAQRAIPPLRSRL